MLLAELLLVMAGHPSSLFPVVADEQQPDTQETDIASQDPHDRQVRRPWMWTMRLADAAAATLHPGEKATLNVLARLAAKNRRVKLFATKIQKDVQRQVLESRGVTTSSRDSSDTHGAQSLYHSTLMAPLAACLLRILGDYQDAVLNTEADILHKSWDMVSLDDGDLHSGPEAKQSPFVSLANIRSRFQDWETPLTSLDALVTTLLQGPDGSASPPKLLSIPQQTSLYPPQMPSCPQWAPGQLLDLFSLLAHTGVRTVQANMVLLLQTIEDAWRRNLVSWMCYGEPFADTHDRSLLPGDALVVWHDGDISTGDESLSATLGSSLKLPRQSTTYEKDEQSLDDRREGWVISRAALPAWVYDDAEVSGAILYVGRAISRIARNATRTAAQSFSIAEHHHPGLPHTLIAEHRNMLSSTSARPCTRPFEFKAIVKDIQTDVAEWMWRNVLTPEVILEVFDTLGSLFLQRDGLFSTSLLEHLSDLRRKKLLTAKSAAAGAIKAADVEFALQRATIGTEFEDSAQLDRCKVAMPEAYTPRPTEKDWRPHPPNTRAGEDEHLDVRFDTIAVDVPFTLRFLAPFPVDLFLAPDELSAYSDLFAYLLALRSVRTRLRDIWSSFSKAQRTRRRFTGTNEGGASSYEERERRRLLLSGCALAREGLWFLEVLIGHFQVDIVDVQFSSFIEQLQSLRPARYDDEEIDDNASLAPSGDMPALGPREAASLKRVSSIGSSIHSRGASLSHDSWARGPPSVPSTLLRRHGNARNTLRSSGLRHAFAEDDRTTAGDTVRGMSASGSHAVPSAPATEANAGLDFATLRATHNAFLTYVLDGLLLTDRTACVSVWRILQTCLRFAGLVDRWGGDVLPELLSEGSISRAANGDSDGIVEPLAMLQERAGVVKEIADALRQHIDAFFLHISSAPSGPSKMASAAAAQTPSFARQAHEKAGVDTAMRREADGAAARHHEQLLLRLDFNGAMSRRSHAAAAAAT